MNLLALGDRFIQWARQEPSVHLLVQIGSRVRSGTEPGAADAWSDWDFQIVSADPAALEARSSFEQAGVGRPLAFVARGGRLGSARKVTALFADGELDVVVIPLEQFRMVREQVRLGRHAEQPAIARGLADLALVLAGGYRILKGSEEAEELFRFVQNDIPLPRLDDAEVRALAEGFVCDFVSTLRKIDRGEYMAAQRWLHHQLAETNFRLQHELRLRAALPSFPDARRAESLWDEAARSALAVDARPDRASLGVAARKTAETCRALVHALVGDTWRWPALPSGLGAE